MTRCHVLLALFLSFSSYAGSIEVAQWVPWNFIKDQYLSKKISQQFEQNDYELRLGELRPLISFRASLEGTMSDVTFTNNGIKASHELSTTIEIGKISIDQIISRNINGNIFQVHIKAECTPFFIRIPRYLSEALLGYKERGDHWSPELAEVNLTVPAWELGDFSCSGIGGLGNEIKTQIVSVLKNPNFFQDVLINALGSEITSTFTTMWTSLLESTSNDISIKSMSRPDSKGAFIFAEMKISGSKSILLKEMNSSDFSQVNPQLVFSDEGFAALLEDKLNKMIPQNYDLQNVSAFKGLMSSKLKKYFVWPDLLRFSSSTPFYFSTDTTQSHLNIRETSLGNYTASYNTNGKLATVIASAPIDYLVFGIGLKTSLTVDLTDGVLSLATKSDASLTLAWNYGFIYQMIFRPNTRIAVDILKSSLVGLFKNQKVSEPLPSLRIRDKEYKLKNWQQNNGIITMDWL